MPPSSPAPPSPANGAPPPRRPGGGFSFVELMVVLAILSFAFTYAVLHLDGVTGGAKLSSAARQVGSTVEFCRGHAIQASRPLELHINLEAAQWEMVIPLRPSEDDAERRNQEEIIVTEPVGLPKNIRFAGIQFDSSTVKTSGTVVITFSPLGEMTPNGFMIRLISDEIADPDAGQFSVEVNGLTGSVDYLPGEAPFEQVVRGDSF